MNLGKVLIPADSPDDWQRFLAEPEKQWKTSFSARSMAYCWQEADGIPTDVNAVLEQAPAFSGMETLLVIPEHKVPLPGGSRSSQNDAWVLARANGELVSIAVEGKVSEPFGPSLQDWDCNSSPGKKERFEYLCSLLDFDTMPTGGIRYQLLHRTASALIEARRFNARSAIMLVHSFSQTEEWFSDYENFLGLFGVQAKLNSVVSAGERSGISLYFAWARGDKKYLEA
jgi:hypothetical protein